MLEGVGSVERSAEWGVGKGRRIACRAGMLVAGRIVRLSIALLPAIHPFRVFTASVMDDLDDVLSPELNGCQRAADSAGESAARL